MITAHAGLSKRTGKSTVKILNHTPRTYSTHDTSDDSHTWSYWYVQSVCLELGNENVERAKEIFDTLRNQAIANIKRAGQKGDASTGTILTEITRLLRFKYMMIERAKHFAPDRGDTSRDRDVDSYDGTTVTELDMIRETESTLRAKYLDENNVPVSSRKSTVMIQGLNGEWIEYARKDVARGKKINGTHPHSTLNLVTTLRV